MNKYFLLFDIGTTTISGAVWDRDSNMLLALGSLLNGQIRFGDDVISRIDFALKKSSNATRLQKAAVSSVNKLTSKLFAQADINNHDIGMVFCVSNAAMHHLFLGIDPSPLVRPPYRPAQKSEITIYAGRMGLKLGKETPLTFLPNIGGFVGSDALSVIIASGIYKSSRIRLAVDLGTNGEVALGNKDKIFVASTAAGPAFEGRHISCGMSAVHGAIESVEMKKSGFKIKVIGQGRPRGVCASGLIDAASVMLKTGIMNNSGRMNTPEFILYKKGKVKISVTQQDIRRLQVAKAAIYACIKVLLRKSGINKDDIKEVFFTGSFGNVIKADSLLTIGLLPRINKERIIFLRNGALEGLRIYLSNTSMERRVTSILSSIRHIPLLGRGFAEEFTSSMSMGQETKHSP